MKILYVDDLKSERDLFGAIMEGQGHEIVFARNGKDALAILKEQLFDIIVSDILMPEMDGFKLCEEVKSDPLTRKIPFVFTSATYTDNQDIKLAYGLGADLFIPKECDLAEYQKALYKAFADLRQIEFDHAVPRLKTSEAMQLYNQILVQKLDQKVRELESEKIETQKKQSLLKEKENQLIHIQRLDAIGTLAGGIAHDFNNILSIILGNTDYALGVEDMDDELREVFQDIHSAGHRAKDLVRQLLNFSRKDPVQKEIIQIASFIKSSIKVLRPLIPKTIEVKQSIRTSDEAVLCNATQLNQVLINLCTNAVHAMKNEGILTIDLESVVVSEDDLPATQGATPGDYVRLSITDTGCGMTEELTQHIFEPYFTTKEPEKGTGMGLSVVYGIIKDHQGAITVNTEVGKGTQFNVYLSMSKRPYGEQVEHEKISLQGKETILFIDDEEMLVNIAQRSISKLGYQFMGFTDPVEALKTFQKAPHEVDVVVADVMMPSLPGHKLAVELLSIRPDIPVILCSSYTELVTAEEALKKGVKVFLRKPLMIPDLINTIRKLLDKL